MGAASGSAAPFRGGKFTTYEGGVRMPAIFHLPGAIAAGRTTGVLASLMDVLPTVLSLAGAAPTAAPMDGEDLARGASA